MIEWKDETMYSQGEKERVPRVWSTRAGKFRISVHRHIHYPPSQWLLSCEGLFRNVALRPEDIDKAKSQAIAKMQVELERAMNEICS